MLIPAVLLAKGQGEERDLLAEAKMLFEEKRYDDARKILAEIIREDPEKFDAVEKIMEQIREVEFILNNKLEEIKGAIFEEQDENKALDLIEEYRLLDPYPNPRIRSILDDLARSVEVVTGLQRFNDLMDDALEKLLGGDYAGALEIYLPGFDILKPRFDGFGYGNIITGAVNGALARVLEATVGYAGWRRDAEAAFTDYRRALQAGDGENTRIRAVDLITSLEGLVSRLRILEEADNVFLSQFEAISQQYSRDDFFLYTANALMGGRPTTDVAEGILYLYRVIYNEPFSNALGDTRERALSLLNQALDSYADGDYGASLSSLESARPYYRAAMELAYFADTDALLNGEYDLDWKSNIPDPSTVENFIEGQARYRETFGYEDFIDELGPLTALRSVPGPASQATLDETRKTVVSSSASLSALYQAWKDNQKRLQDVSAPVAQSAGVLAERIAAAIGDYLGEFLRLSQSYLAENQNLFAVENDKLFNGEEVLLSAETGATRIEKYPDVRLANFRTLQGNMVFLLEEATTVRDSWDAEPGSSLTIASRTTEVEPKISELDTIAAKVEELLSVVQLAIDTAIDENLEADKYVRLGQDNFSNAQAAFNDRRFDDAREGVNLAMEALDRSLEYREDAAVRRLRDEAYPAFFTQINLRENERVITEVRNLIRRGIQLYRESQFEDAQTVLVQAQSRWRDVNPSDNEEVTDWLTLVRKAINLKKGWVIQETEAPYEQITQLLRLTGSDYNQAIAYLDEGNERSAEQSFENALSKLDQIQINFPKLKEANNLRLQIKQIQEPDQYRREFEQELSRAAAVLSRGVQGEIQETYSTLKDYELMEASSARLADLIFNYEIALGLRLPPPSASEIAESRDKYALAADIFNKKQRDLYDTAIDLLNEALKLWPDNRNAEDLKDDILRNLGQTIQTLSSDDMRRLEEAERLFGDRDYTGSYRIIVDLLKNPKNQNNDRIIDLKSKLETRLGIGETEG